MPESTEAQTIAELAIESAEPTALDPLAIYGITIPNGANWHVADLEQYLPEPRRKRGTVSLHDATSLSSYVNAHKTPGSALYADIDHDTVTAVLNGHLHVSDGGDPGWGDHRAVLTLRRTPAWSHWHGQDRKWLSQEQFASHVEEGLPEIVAPSAAEMLEVAQTLQVNSKVAFRQSTLLNNGQRQFTYEETLDSKAGQKGTLSVPTSLTLGLATYEGQTEAHRVTARFQFRIDGGDLKLRYLMDRPADVIREAFLLVVNGIEDGTGILAFRGRPAGA